MLLLEMSQSLKSKYCPRTVGIGTIKLSNRLLSVFLQLVGHVGRSLGSSGAVISQLKSNDSANSAEELLQP
jgi:hypothetical protein